MSDTLDTIGSRAKLVRKEAGKNQSQMAELLGLAIGTWQKLERDEVVPTGETLIQFERLGINPGWVLTGLGPKKLREEVVSPQVDDGQMVRIKHYNVAAAAGGGLVPVDEHEEQDDIILARSFLRRLGAAPDQSQVIFAKGESMLPTIPDGSLLLIDRSKTHLVEGGVFVFRVGEGIKVKRARWRADQRIDLLSDNQLAGYPPETYTRDEIATIVPLGRVMCVMRVP